MKFGHIEIFVSDPIKSSKFYIDILGFKLDQIQKDRFVWLTYDKIAFLLRPLRLASKSTLYQEAATTHVFYTDDLHSAVNTLKNRGLKFKGTDGSDKCLTFTDLDGNWFQLVNPNEH